MAAYWRQPAAATVDKRRWPGGRRPVVSATAASVGKRISSVPDAVGAAATAATAAAAS
jgi:hypothetical protein